MSAEPLPTVLAKGGTGEGVGVVGLIPAQVMQPVTSWGLVKLIALLLVHPTELHAWT